MRAIDEKQAASLSASLVQELASLVMSSVDNFTFELISTTFFEKGSVSKGYPFIEVLWFARSQEIQDACAQFITSEVKKLLPGEDVAVVFTVLNPSAYYENSKSF
jgi:hypothetical protein